MPTSSPSASLVLLALAASCRAQRPSDRAAEEVLAEVRPAGGALISRARLRRRHVERQAGAGGGGHGGVFGSASRATPAHDEWIVEAEGTAAGSRLVASRPSPPAAAPRPDDAARARLVSAPDGHALAYSLDAGATWTTLALDLGRRWVAFEGAPGASAAGWPDAPPSRQLLLGALRSGSARAPSVYRDELVSEHLGPALALVCAAPDDEALALASAEAFISHVNPMSVSYAGLRLADSACLRLAARRLPTLRLALREAVAAPVARRREMAAWVLADGALADDQDALARALVEPVPAGAEVPATGHTRLFMAWALAASAADRGAATPAAVDALSAVASGPAPLPYASWRLARVHALRGLAAVAAEPRARAALATIAVGACARPVTSPVGPFEFVSERELDAASSEPSCWARAALGAADGGAP